jgi:hypothetical protein
VELMEGFCCKVMGEIPYHQGSDIMIFTPRVYRLPSQPAGVSINLCRDPADVARRS